ncbi:MAG TPA: GDSL-type esterase/lipase family protein [Solirubrobacteraceae bacterium]|nr:GDSL-type esterase/lipase family protein [Solirubrobacteraceae bacterium]
MPARPTSLLHDPRSRTEPLGAFRMGVLALGDSITNGGGELQWGVALQSWALWTARGLGVPYSSYAVDGATVDDVLEGQIPLFGRAVADPYSRYSLGCLYIGTNDVRRPGFALDRFEERHGQALSFLREHCDRRLTATLPLDMGRPRNPDLVERVNAAIERSAAAHEALVLDLRRFGGRRVVMHDHVHPTALGQVAMARAALAVLAADGLPTRVDPGQLVSYQTTAGGRLRGDMTYAYRHLKQDARRFIENRRSPDGGS